MNAQDVVANAVKARGYWDLYTAEQVLARNLVKMIEELAEAAAPVYLDAPGTDGSLDQALLLVGEEARERFDETDPAAWADSLIPHRRAWGALAEELADMQVVLLNAAQAFAEVRGEPFDVVAAAVTKALADVDRGVRGSQETSA